MGNHQMSIVHAYGRFWVYCWCGWHNDDGFLSFHEAASCWFHHKEVGWVKEEYGE